MATTPEAAKTSFPPFDQSTFEPQLVWLAIVFGILYLLMSRVALPRIEAIFDARRVAREADISEAARLRSETESAIASFEKALADAHARAEDISNQTRDRLNVEITKKRSVFDAELTANRDTEERTIAERKDKAMANVGEIASEVTLAIVRQLSGVTPVTSEAAAVVGRVLKN